MSTHTRSCATPSKRGVRYFDTAPHYGNGLSEHRIGAALREMPRDTYVLSTKVGRLLVPDAAAPRNQHGYVDVLPFVQRWDYSYDGTLRSVEDSLQRLGLARIDYVYIHDVARDAHGDDAPRRFREAMDGAVPALSRLRAEGAIAGFGLGVNEVQVCIDALAHADLDVLLARRPLHAARPVGAAGAVADVREAGNARRVGRAVQFRHSRDRRAPRDGAPRTSTMRRRRRTSSPASAAIEAVCAAHGVALKAAALQFPRAHPAVACVLAGARSRPPSSTRISRWPRFRFPRAFWRDLRSAGLIAAGAPLPGEIRERSDACCAPGSTRITTSGGSTVATTAGSRPSSGADPPRFHARRSAAVAADAGDRGNGARPGGADGRRNGISAATSRTKATASCAASSAGSTWQRADAVSTLARLARDPLLKSIRPMLQDLPDPDWILRLRCAATCLSALTGARPPLRRAGQARAAAGAAVHARAPSRCSPSSSTTVRSHRSRPGRGSRGPT